MWLKLSDNSINMRVSSIKLKRVLIRKDNIQTADKQCRLQTNSSLAANKDKLEPSY